jgi:hypothetical protein
MILNKTPPEKTLSTKRMLWRAQSPACARAGGQILTCVPAGDSKNEPHREKKPSYFFLQSVWTRNHKETRHQTSAASGAMTQSHNAMQRRHLCSASACTQPRKDNKETTIKMVFSFPPKERVPFSLPRKDDGARVATARAPSQRLSVRTMGRHNNQKGAIGAKERQQRNNNQNGIFCFS